MGKRIDQLKLDDTPIEAPDERDSEWYRFSQDIDDLLATGEYTWAEDTLTGIQETVERIKRVTAAQKRAVTNIENARERRRYEGWRRR